MIKIEHLAKQYGRIKAVNDISFEIHDGEIVGFLGPNGAGKSTTMNILCGYLSCSAGKAEINGMDILENPLEAKKQIGFLPEQPPLYMDMTVEEYLNFIYDLKDTTLKRDEHLAEICEVTGIAHMRKRLIRNLSKGYKQRVGIAQALIGNPSVLIFDAYGRAGSEADCGSAESDSFFGQKAHGDPVYPYSLGGAGCLRPDHHHQQRNDRGQ